MLGLIYIWNHCPTPLHLKQNYAVSASHVDSAFAPIVCRQENAIPQYASLAEELLLVDYFDYFTL